MRREKSSAAESTLSVEYEFKLQRSGHKRKPKPPKPLKKIRKLPHITRLLALAHHLEDLIKQGTVNDYADIARLSNLTRARLSQIMALTLLAPKIQEEILSYTADSAVDIKERNLRKVLKAHLWNEQDKIWKVEIQ